MATQPRICSARTCNKEIGDSDQAYPFPSGSRGITWQELLLGTVYRQTGALIVCSSHFSERQYVTGKFGRKQLSRNALPDVNILSNGKVCRFCLEPSKVNMYPLFSHHPDVPSLEDIERTVNIRIRQHDGLPEVACATCMSKVRYIKRIQDQFQESDRKLRVRLNIPDKPDQEFDEEPAMEEEYLLEQKPDQQDNILLTADQLTIVEGAQEEIETSETPSREESPIQPEKTEESTTECMMLFSGDIQEQTTATATEISVEYDMTELSTGDDGGGGADSDENAGNDSDDQQAEQTNGNSYKPFRYSKRARRERD